MEAIQKQRLNTFLVLLTAIGIVLLFAWFNQQTLKAQQQANRIWQNYASEEVQISHSISRLYQLIGYEGFIHHYKNYLIRQNPSDYERLKIDSKNIRTELQRLSQKLSQTEELQALDRINAIFSRYIGNIEEIQRLQQLDYSIEDIDKLLQINDSSALLALEVLNDRVQYRLLQTRTRAQKQVEYNRHLSHMSWLLLIPVLGFSILILVLLRRSQNLTIEAQNAYKGINQLLDTTPDPMLFSDMQGRIHRVNQSAVNFFGYTEIELKNMTIEQLIPENHRSRHAKLRESFQAAPENRTMNQGQAVKALCADDRQADVQIRLSYWDNPFRPLIIASIRDVSKEVKNQAMLRQNHKELSAALKKLQQATHILAENEKMAALGTLVAGVSHEINTPLGVSLTGITHLHDQTEKIKKAFKNDLLSIEELEAYLQLQTETSELITHNLQQAATLINNFKQIAIDQSQTDFRKINLRNYISETLTSLKPSFKHSAIETRFDCENDIEITTYPGAISQILNNLVINSVQHAFADNRSGYISIQVMKDEIGQQVILRISDNGSGMDEHTRQHMMEPFFTTARSKGGSGLGMNIVYNLVTHSLKGKIKIESTPDQGTDIFITLPLNIESVQNDHSPIFNMTSSTPDREK